MPGQARKAAVVRQRAELPESAASQPFCRRHSATSLGLYSYVQMQIFGGHSGAALLDLQAGPQQDVGNQVTAFLNLFKFLNVFEKRLNLLPRNLKSHELTTQQLNKTSPDDVSAETCIELTVLFNTLPLYINNNNNSNNNQTLCGFRGLE